jgi:hypothetical protein
MHFTVLCLFAALATVGLAQILTRPECEPTICTYGQLGKGCTSCLTSYGIAPTSPKRGKCRRYVHPYLELSYSIDLLLICTGMPGMQVVGTTANSGRSCRTAIALFGDVEQQRKPAGEVDVCELRGTWRCYGVGGGSFSRWARGLRGGVGEPSSCSTSNIASHLGNL